MWTPQGYYTGSPGADKIVGWQINKGPENAADYVGADQLRAAPATGPTSSRRPSSWPRPSRPCASRPAPPSSSPTCWRKPVPKFRIVSPAGGTIAARRTRMVQDRRRGRCPIRSRPSACRSTAARSTEITPDIGSGGFRAGEHTLDVPLAKGRNEVRITLDQRHRRQGRDRQSSTTTATATSTSAARSTSWPSASTAIRASATPAGRTAPPAAICAIRAPMRARLVAGRREAARARPHQGRQARAGQRRRRQGRAHRHATSSMPSTC